MNRLVADRAKDLWFGGAVGVSHLSLVSFCAEDCITNCAIAYREMKKRCCPMNRSPLCLQGGSEQALADVAVRTHAPRARNAFSTETESRARVLLDPE